MRVYTRLLQDESKRSVLFFHNAADMDLLYLATCIRTHGAQKL